MGSSLALLQVSVLLATEVGVLRGLLQCQVHVEAWVQHQLLPAGQPDSVPGHQGHSAQHHHQQK